MMKTTELLLLFLCFVPTPQQARPVFRHHFWTCAFFVVTREKDARATRGRS